MPTYEYRCQDCAHDFERFQRMSDPPVAECPECGGTPERLLSAGAGLLFKGDGFYITDYRSDSYKKGAEKDSSASAEGGGGSKSSSGSSDSSSSGSSGSGSSGGDGPSSAGADKSGGSKGSGGSTAGGDA
ncbi:MAG: FmdB family zinc ribbon protein [Longimicrobiales bacterium]